MRIYIIKLRPSWDRFILIMGIPILVRRCLCIETALRFPYYWSFAGPLWRESTPNTSHVDHRLIYRPTERHISEGRVLIKQFVFSSNKLYFLMSSDVMGSINKQDRNISFSIENFTARQLFKRFCPSGSEVTCNSYRKTSNIRRTSVGNKIVDHSDVVGASPVGAAPTTSSFST